MTGIKFIIYLDTKIKGALLQTLKYFDQGIFDNKVMIIFKEYKVISKYFKNRLKAYNIEYIAYNKYKDIPNLKGKIVFYLFNAQSNCRIVADRGATHIFVTHGESNKISSIKPIIKIYDHVIVSGDLGIDRYLENKLFYKDDVKRHKIIKMGTTFIGSPSYEYNEAAKSILYAPTWEGGIIEENYSSMDEQNSSFKLLGKYAKANSIKHIIVQPHPNTGHRDKRFYKYLINGINYLLDYGYKITILDFKIPLFFKFRLKKNSQLSFSNTETGISKAFVDVSAMEIQLISKNIPTYVFFINLNNYMPSNPLLKMHYKNCGIYDFKFKKYDHIDNGVKNYCISYENDELKNTPINKRIAWLEEYLSSIK